MSTLRLLTALALVSLTLALPARSEPSPAEQELSELRTAATRTYLREDGTLRLERSPQPRHYLADDGTWQTIETSVRLARDGSFVNDANALVSAFPATADGDVVLWQRADGAHLRVRPAGLSVRHADGSTTRLSGPIDVGGEIDSDGSVVYRGVYPHVSEIWRVAPGRVRHELVIKGPPDGVQPAEGDVLVLSWTAEVESNDVDAGARRLEAEVPLAGLADHPIVLATTAVELAGARLGPTTEPPGLEGPEGLGGGVAWECPEQQKLMAPDGASSDNLGQSVAISGDTALIGADKDDFSALTDAGSAYVFVRTGGIWTFEQKLTAPDAAAADSFGWTVALSADTAVIGAPNDDLSGAANAGSAYVFVRSGGTWTLQKKLIASDATVGNSFGVSVSVAGDSAVVGAHFNVASRGAAYVFVRSGTTWAQQQKLVASDATFFDQLGFAVSIDGDTALIGAPFDDIGAFTDAGSAYVFVRSGTTWTEQQKLTQVTPASGDFFGRYVSVSGDTAAVDAPTEDHPALVSAGAVHVFVRSGTVWTLEQVLMASVPHQGGPLGAAFGPVALSGDTLVVGGPTVPIGGSSSGGAVYLFVRSGTAWTEEQILLSSDRASGDFFGNSVSLSGDTVLAGAWLENNAGGVDAGSAYVFTCAPAVDPCAENQCDDGDACNGLETCDPETGDCIAGTPVTCDDGDACNGLETCEPGTGDCIAGTPVTCGDFDACNGLETCDPGTGDCIAGTPVTCDDGNACNGLETCDPETGNCIAGTPVTCDDGNACNGLETCDTETGNCIAGTPVTCDDGNACNGLETCDTATGDCIAGTPVTCDDGDACNGLETCDPETGNCSAGTPVTCDDGNACNGLETCDPETGNCIAGTPVTCDDGNACNGLETCDTETGNCIAGTPVTCDDADACNGLETCDTATGDCIAGTPVTCGDFDVCNGLETCDPETGNCIAGTPVSCDDGDACNGLETCDAETGDCIAGTPVTCDDGNACNGLETCAPATGLCAPGAPPSCDDGDTCTIDGCAPATGCTHVLDPASSCAQENACPCDGPWQNHGQYVSCVTQHANGLVAAGVITSQEKGARVSAAADSDCGR